MVGASTRRQANMNRFLLSSDHMTPILGPLIWVPNSTIAEISSSVTAGLGRKENGKFGRPGSVTPTLIRALDRYVTQTRPRPSGAMASVSGLSAVISVGPDSSLHIPAPRYTSLYRWLVRKFPDTERLSRRAMYSDRPRMAVSARSHGSAPGRRKIGC